MVKKPKPEADRFYFTLFKRPRQDGSVVIYARLLEKSTGRILAQRSTGTEDERMAAAKAGQFLVELPLAKLAKAKAAKNQDGFESAERLRNMDLATFFTWFWTPGASDYLRDREDAEKPLAAYYIQNQGRYIAKHASGYQPFKRTPLREASLYLIDQQHAAQGIDNCLRVAGLFDMLTVPGLHDPAFTIGEVAL